jgi:hypothetical protein
MSIIHAHLIWLTAIVALAGCGGGSSLGGGEMGPPATQAFTSWSAVQPNSKVMAQGMSKTASATVSMASNGDVTLTSIPQVSGSIPARPAPRSRLVRGRIPNRTATNVQAKVSEPISLTTA